MNIETEDNIERLRCEACKLEGSRNGWRMIAFVEFLCLVLSVLIICKFVR